MIELRASATTIILAVETTYNAESFENRRTASGMGVQVSGTRQLE